MNCRTIDDIIERKYAERVICLDNDNRKDINEADGSENTEAKADLPDEDKEAQSSADEELSENGEKYSEKRETDDDNSEAENAAEENETVENETDEDGQSQEEAENSDEEDSHAEGTESEESEDEENETAETDENAENGEEEAPEENEQGEIICTACHKNTVANGHKYCRKCEKKLVKVKLPFLPCLIALVSILVSLFALLIVCLDSAPALQAFQGDYYRAKHNYYAAYTGYSGVEDTISQINESMGSVPVISTFVAKGSNLDMKIYDLLVKIYNPLQAEQSKSYIFTSAGAEKYMAKSKQLSKYSEIYSVYESTYNALTDPLTELSTLENPTAKDAAGILAQMEKVRGKKGVDNVLLDYFMYNVAGACSLDDETKYKYLDMVADDAKKSSENYDWLYLEDYIASLVARDRDDEAVPLIEAQMKEDVSNYEPYRQRTRIYVKQKDLDKAEDVVEEYCDNNRTSEGELSDYSYALVMYLYRCQGKYDVMLDLLSQAEETYNLIPEFNRQAALVYLIKGDYDNAFEQAFSAENKAYYRYSYYSDSSGYTEELNATVYLCTYLCKEKGKKNTDNAQYIEEIMSSYKGQEFGETVDSIVSGKVTPKEALTKGVCDLK